MQKLWGVFALTLRFLTVLNSQVAKQASMFAFERLFMYFGIGMLAALPLLALMTRTHFQRAGRQRMRIEPQRAKS